MFEIDELQDWKFLLCYYQGQGLIKFQSVNKIDKKKVIGWCFLILNSNKRYLYNFTHR